jgi:hypothetical protein
MHSIGLLLSLLAQAPSTYVVIVGNNTSPVLGRPQLAYADDDAARYVDVFESMLSAPSVELLTEFDIDSERLYPRLAARAKAPTRAEVQAAFERLGRWGKTEKASGHRTRGYFIFAGHGDVEQGQGFLELRDGRLTSSEFEALLKAAGVDELHVVLDSCNSWFVLNPRKPGGKRFPTPQEATQALMERLPNVGVLLSTSAEAEVYEWSELQSGIFSYALRSGLIGAADVNGDGDVAYEELAGFIKTATATVKNPNLRPHLFARGPKGSLVASFATLSSEKAVTLKSEGPLTLRVRDESGLRQFDVNVRGSVSLRLPALSSAGAQLSIQKEDRWQSFSLPGGVQTVEARQLVAASTVGSARGVTSALEALFSAQFGQEELDAWRTAEVVENQKAIGISQATVARVQFALNVASQRDRANRLTAAALFGGLGAGYLIGGIGLLAAPRPRPAFGPSFHDLGGLLLGFAGLVTVGVPAALLLKGDWEKASEQFDIAVKAGSVEAALVGVDTFIEKRQQLYQTGLAVLRAAGIIMIIAGVVITVAGLALLPNTSPSSGPIGVAVGGIFIGGGAAYVASSFLMRSPEQDLIDILNEERKPLLPAAPRVGVAPINGGAMLSLSGAF